MTFLQRYVLIADQHDTLFISECFCFKRAYKIVFGIVTECHEGIWSSSSGSFIMSIIDINKMYWCPDILMYNLS